MFHVVAPRLKNPVGNALPGCLLVVSFPLFLWTLVFPLFAILPFNDLEMRIMDFTRAVKRPFRGLNAASEALIR